MNGNITAKLKRLDSRFDRHGKIPAVSGVPLEELLKSYDRVQKWFREVCLELTDDDLDRVNENGKSH